MLIIGSPRLCNYRNTAPGTETGPFGSRCLSGYSIACAPVTRRFKAMCIYRFVSRGKENERNGEKTVFPLQKQRWLFSRTALSLVPAQNVADIKRTPSLPLRHDTRRKLAVSLQFVVNLRTARDFATIANRENLTKVKTRRRRTAFLRKLNSFGLRG